MRHYALALLIPLAACATPRETCEANAVMDLQVVSALIVETQQNIARGYAVQTEVRSRPTFTWCVGDTLGSDDTVGLQWCNTTETYESEKAVAIDANAERAKLQSLLKKRAELEKTSQMALAQCAAQYPEG